MDNPLLSFNSSMVQFYSNTVQYSPVCRNPTPPWGTKLSCYGNRKLFIVCYQLHPSTTVGHNINQFLFNELTTAVNILLKSISTLSSMIVRHYSWNTWKSSSAVFCLMWCSHTQLYYINCEEKKTIWWIWSKIEWNIQYFTLQISSDTLVNNRSKWQHVWK